MRKLASTTIYDMYYVYEQTITAPGSLVEAEMVTCNIIVSDLFGRIPSQCFVRIFRAEMTKNLNLFPSLLKIITFFFYWQYRYE